MRLRDSYREINPDPVPIRHHLDSGYPVPHRDANETIDRIDQIYALGNSTTVASQMSARPAGRHRYRDHALAVGPSRRGLHFKAIPGPARQ